MAPTPSIKIVKQIPWRGGTRTYANRYHFTGADPTGSTQWTTLADNIVADEASFHPTTVTIVEAVGYNAGSDLPVFTKAYSTAGTHNMTSASHVPGECAALLRYTTTQRTSKNHPIYLFNYYHHIPTDASGAGDVVQSAYKTAIEAVATDWLTGYSDGSSLRQRAGPNGAVAQTRLVDTYLTHRDFPR